MKTRKLLSCAVTLLLVGTLFAGCGASAPADSGSAQSAAPSSGEATAQTDSSSVTSSDKPIKIGVSLFTRQHVFFNRFEEAMKAEADRMGVEAVFVDANTDSNKQFTQVQDFVTQGVDSMIVIPVATAGSKGAVDLAKSAGIPILTAFTKSDAAPEDIICHMGTDELVGGELAAKYLLEKVLPDHKGEVAIISYDEVENCVLRSDGFKEALKDYPEIKIVDMQNYSGDAAKASDITQDFLVKHPNLNAIFAVGDPAAMGAYTIINGAQKDIKIIGYDGNPEAITEIIKGGNWVADIAQDPEGIGQAMIQNAVAAAKGEEVLKEQYIVPYIIDKDKTTK